VTSPYLQYFSPMKTAISITIVQGPEGGTELAQRCYQSGGKEISKLPEVTGTFALGGFSFSGSSAIMA